MYFLLNVKKKAATYLDLIVKTKVTFYSLSFTLPLDIICSILLSNSEVRNKLSLIKTRWKYHTILPTPLVLILKNNHIWACSVCDTLACDSAER